MKNKLLLISMFSIILISCSFVSSTVETLGTFKTESNVTLLQSGESFTQCNVTSVLYPNSTKAIGGFEMTKDKTEYSYLLDSQYTKPYGQYIVNGFCTNGTATIVWAYDFDITPSGFLLTSGSGITLVGSVLMILVVGIVFIIIANKTEKTAPKILFYTLSGITFVMAILYTVITIQQTLFGFESIQTGIETFWFVMKILVGLGVTALIIIVFLILLKAWQIKRGYKDE